MIDCKLTLELLPSVLLIADKMARCTLALAGMRLGPVRLYLACKAAQPLWVDEGTIELGQWCYVRQGVYHWLEGPLARRSLLCRAWHR